MRQRRLTCMSSVDAPILRMLCLCSNVDTYASPGIGHAAVVDVMEQRERVYAASA